MSSDWKEILIAEMAGNIFTTLGVTVRWLRPAVTVHQLVLGARRAGEARGSNPYRALGLFSNSSYFLGQ